MEQGRQLRDSVTLKGYNFFIFKFSASSHKDNWENSLGAIRTHKKISDFPKKLIYMDLKNFKRRIFKTL